MSTLRAMQSLGAHISRESTSGDTIIEGRGLEFSVPAGPIDCGNSGTTMRLLSGLLSGQGGRAGTSRFELDGDSSLRRRPMDRVARPLAKFGAAIETSGGRAPIVVHGRRLHAAAVSLEVASAQLKSALLLAAIQAEGESEIIEPALSRDHSERMLQAMGVDLVRESLSLRVRGPALPHAVDVEVCGDPSSAAFLAVAASIVEGSDVLIENVCINPTRTGFLKVLERMGADITVEAVERSGVEPKGSLRVRGARLEAFQLKAEEVPATIDELPLLAVAAACAQGRSVIGGAGELRVKESDRISSTVALLESIGAEVYERPDGLEIVGGALEGAAVVDAAGDHRLVMSAAVAGLACRHPLEIGDISPVAVSFPEFFSVLEGLRG